MLYWGGRHRAGDAHPGQPGGRCKWQVRQKAGDGGRDAWPDISGSGLDTTSHAVSGLSGGTTCEFEGRAVNGAGNGVGADATAEGTLNDRGLWRLVSKVDEALLPKAAAVLQTLAAVRGRIGTAASGSAAGGSMRFGALPAPRLVRTAGPEHEPDRREQVGELDRAHASGSGSGGRVRGDISTRGRESDCATWRPARPWRTHACPVRFR